MKSRTAKMAIAIGAMAFLAGCATTFVPPNKATIYSMSLGAFGNGGGRLVPKTVPNQNALAQECRK